MGEAMVIEAILGVVAGGMGSWISKGIGLFEKRQEFEHELKLLEMQMQAAQAETENELAIAQEESYSGMRQASYQHDVATQNVSLWVRNVLRLVRPVLTLLLILLVWAIWLTVAQDDAGMRRQIVDGVLFMASAAMAWWFGDRAPHTKKLPWQG